MRNSVGWGAMIGAVLGVVVLAVQWVRGKFQSDPGPGSVEDRP